MTKGEIKELYQVMFTEYPDIVRVKDLQKMLGIGKISHIPLFRTDIFTVLS